VPLTYRCGQNVASVGLNVSFKTHGLWEERRNSIGVNTIAVSLADHHIIRASTEQLVPLYWLCARNLREEQDWDGRLRDEVHGEEGEELHDRDRPA
jgi:hypothetical protein